MTQKMNFMRNVEVMLHLIYSKKFHVNNEDEEKRWETWKGWATKIVSVLLDNRAHYSIKDFNGETEYITQYKLTVQKIRAVFLNLEETLKKLQR